MKDKKIVQRKIVAGVASRDGRILIIQRSADENFYPNRWELPSGKREPLEPTEETLTREFKEETNLNVKITGIVSVFDYQIQNDDEIRDATQINFLLEPAIYSDVKLSKEHQNFAWIREDEIENYDITEQTKDVIYEAFKMLEKK
jgi:8-oxo-dGTP diphosphatase